MIPRTLCKNTRFAVLNAKRAISSTIPIAGGPSQHPHTQLEDTTKGDANASPNPSNSDAAKPTAGDSTTFNTSTQGTSASQDAAPSNAIAIPQVDASQIPHIVPFHTYQFFLALEKSFPTPVARTLMRATRGMLVDRMLKIKRDALDVKDLDNVSFFSMGLDNYAKKRSFVASISISCGFIRIEDGIYNEDEESICCNYNINIRFTTRS